MQKEELVVGIDIETTGLTPGFHEICAIFMRLFDLNTWEKKSELKLEIKPIHFSRISRKALQINGYTREQLKTFMSPIKARGNFATWHDGALDGEPIHVLGHNYGFDKSFIELWLGQERYREIFHYHYRDTQIFALGLQDKGLLDKNISVSLQSLCDEFGLPLYPHRVDSDCKCTILLYKELLKL